MLLPRHGLCTAAACLRHRVLRPIRPGGQGSCAHRTLGAQSRPRGRRVGYSLIELLVVLAILATLASVAWPMAEMAARRQREAELRRSLWEIREAIDAYRRAREAGAVPGLAGESLYPSRLDTLTRLHADARPDVRGAPLRFLRRIPRDPYAAANLPADQTWGLRSLASEADRPAPGAEVFDVYSLSDAVGLDGTPVRQW
jgi:general secretion pathway protein G